MLEYLTQDEYIELTGAPNVPVNFKQLNYEASAYINKMTFGRIKTPNETVKYVTSLLINMLINERAEQAEIGNIKSENVDGWSRTYAGAEELDKAYKQKKYDLLKLYLIHEVDQNGTPLLYRG